MLSRKTEVTDNCNDSDLRIVAASFGTVDRAKRSDVVATWSRVPHDEDVFATSGGEVWAGAHQERMLSATAGGPGLVAVGFDSVDDCGWDSAVGTSPDGLNWSRVPDERGCPYAGPYDRMLSVTVGPSGLVAVGRNTTRGPQRFGTAERHNESKRISHP